VERKSRPTDDRKREESAIGVERLCSYKEPPSSGAVWKHLCFVTL